VYDMYRWDQQAGRSEQAAAAEPSRRGEVRGADEAVRAVQEALDRRDNGGRTAATPDR
jgi:hypothetical protein